MDKSATKSGANGEAAAAPKASTKPVTAALDAVQNRLAQRFSQVIAVMMRDSKMKKVRLEELEWLVLPPVLSGQFKLGHATRPGVDQKPEQGGVAFPVTVALWARVSDQIDRQLAANLDKPFRLKASDWTSGDNIWLIATAGDPRMLGHFLKQLHETEFKGKTVKLRSKDKDGNLIVRVMGEPAAG